MNAPTHLSGEITPEELHHWLDSGKPLMLLDVMGTDCFGEGHIASAVQACVYETAFMGQVESLNADKGASVVVYGTGKPSLASQVAAEKLRDAGYSHVYELRGGLDAWRSAGYPVSGDAAKPEAAALSGKWVLDVEKSVVRWTGRNLLNHHEGTVNFREGEIELKDGKLVRAGFTVDMGTIRNADLTDPDWNAMLIRHLIDADFFHVKQWPDASFEMKTATPIADAKPGSPNYRVSGDFTLRGQTHGIEFEAVIGDSEGVLAGQAEFDLDRTRWGALYGSGKFFDRLGKHLVNDLVHLHLKILANKKGG
ncbi:MAG TPA: YceI family protein [Verrucomicrobiales bacterium]|jgi:rhodanese-related sulfurtransferase|nr:YceI family protein [Verrucomicrobiales bacterium]